MKRHLEVVDGAYQRKLRRQWRFVRVMEWVADVHLFIYPLLVLAFFWYFAFGSK